MWSAADSCLQSALSVFEAVCNREIASSDLNNVIKIMGDEYRSRRPTLIDRINNLKSIIHEPSETHPFVANNSKRVLDSALQQYKSINYDGVSSMLSITKQFAQKLQDINTINREGSKDVVRRHGESRRRKLHDEFVAKRKQCVKDEKAMSDIDAEQSAELKTVREECEKMMNQIDAKYNNKMRKYIESTRSKVNEKAESIIDDIQNVLADVHAELSSLRVDDPSGVVSKHEALFKAQCEEVRLRTVRIIIVQAVSLR